MGGTDQAKKWRFRTFGELAIEPSSSNIKFRTRKTKALATLLAIRPGTLFSRDSLAGIFWPDDRQDTARQSVRMAISNIRSELGKDSVITDRLKVGLNPDYVSSDLSEFEEITQKVRRISADALSLRLKAFEIASQPWLPDIEADWISAQSHRIQEQVVENALLLVELLRSDKKFSEAIQVAKQTLENVEFREDIHVALMQLYVDSGMTSQAIAQFETLEQQLDDLWGEPPSAAAVSVLESAPRSDLVLRVPSKRQPIYGLFGRQTEVEQIIGLLTNNNSSVVTLAGTGGCGKTSLAKAVAKILGERNITCHFIDLTTATTLQSATEKILLDLNIASIDIYEAIPAIVRNINQSEAIYIFDNLEQLGADANTLIEQIYSRTPKANFLITTRIPLNLEFETLIHINPLDYPERGTNLDQIRQSSAIQLFEEQAVRVNPQFLITTQNANSVIELCRRLDGLPLAIKLAAARIVIRTPAQILASIHSNLDSLKSSDPASTERHSNIRSTVEWSVELLSEQSKSAALALSLFNGRFDEQICKALLPGYDVLSVLEELVASSILNVDTAGDTSEFWFFETVRSSLQSILGEGDAYESGMGQLLDYCYAKTHEIELKTDLPAWQVVREHIKNAENTLKSIEFAVEQTNFNPRAAELAVKANKYLYTMSNERLTPLLEKFYNWPDSNISQIQRACLGCALADSISNRGDVDEQRRIFQECAELANGDISASKLVRSGLGNVYKVTGEYDKAIEEMNWVLEHTDPKDHEAMANNIYRIALMYGCKDDRKKTFVLLKEALPHARKSQDINNLVRILFDLGSEYAHFGEGDKAIETFIEAEAICQSVGSRKLEGLTRWQHGDALLDLHRPEEALDLLKQSITLVYEGNFPAAEKWIFIRAAQAAMECGSPEVGAKLLAKGQYVRDSENRAFAVYEQNYLDSIAETISKSLSETDIQRIKFEAPQYQWADLWQEFQAVVPH